MSSCPDWRTGYFYTAHWRLPRIQFWPDSLHMKRRFSSMGCIRVHSGYEKSFLPKGYLVIHSASHSRSSQPGPVKLCMDVLQAFYIGATWGEDERKLSGRWWMNVQATRCWVSPPISWKKILKPKMFDLQANQVVVALKQHPAMFKDSNSKTSNSVTPSTHSFYSGLYILLDTTFYWVLVGHFVMHYLFYPWPGTDQTHLSNLCLLCFLTLTVFQLP